MALVVCVLRLRDIVVNIITINDALPTIVIITSIVIIWQETSLQTQQATTKGAETKERGVIHSN